MKDKIIIFMIGLLVGAVISTASFYVYTLSNNNNSNNNIQMNGGQPPSMPGGQNSDLNEPPEKPSGDNQNMEKTSDDVTTNS